MLKNPGLLTLWGGEFTSRIGESIFQIALLWYLLEVTHSSLATGLVTMVAYLPAFVVGLWAGVIVDRLDYRRVLLSANVARTVLAACIPLLTLSAGLHVPAIAALGFLLTSASAFFSPARDAMIPILAQGGSLVSANSLVQSAWQFSLVIGPFLAAAALPFMPTAYLFFGVALAFALSLLILWHLRRSASGALRVAAPVSPLEGADSSTASAEVPPSKSRFVSELLGGARYLRAERRVFWVWLITVVNNFFLMGPIFVGMPVYVKTYLGGTGSDFALIEGTYAGGMIVSTWLISRFGQRVNPMRLLFLALIYDGLTLVPLVWVSSVPGTVLTILIHSLGIPAITISRITALHRIVPQQLLGRVFSYFHLAVAGMTALSIGVVGGVLTDLPANQLFACIGMLCGLTGLVGFFIPALRDA